MTSSPGCRDRQVLLSAFASAMFRGAADVAAAPYLSAAAGLPAAGSPRPGPPRRRRGGGGTCPTFNHQPWLGTGAGQLAARGGAGRGPPRASRSRQRRGTPGRHANFHGPPSRGTRVLGHLVVTTVPGRRFHPTGPVGPLPAVETGCATRRRRGPPRDMGCRDQPAGTHLEHHRPGRLGTAHGATRATSPRHAGTTGTTSTGRAGTWMLPDWPRAARDWDGVHLSITGYITGTGFAIPAQARRPS